MRVVLKFGKNYGLSNETSLEKIGGGFLFHFFTLFTESGKMLILKFIETKISPHSIKTPKISIHLRLTIYFCDHFKVRKQWLEVE
jgi:hypothetical protein